MEVSSLYGLIGFFLAIGLTGEVYRLKKRVKELEKPIEQKKREEASLNKAEVLALIEKNNKKG